MDVTGITPGTGKICAVTGKSTVTKTMHWTRNRQTDIDWFGENDMAVIYGQGDLREQDTPRNMVCLRRDLLWDISQGVLLVVPKGEQGQFTLHATTGEEVVGFVEDGYHGSIFNVSEESAPFVFARFAFSTMEFPSRFEVE